MKQYALRTSLQKALGQKSLHELDDRQLLLALLSYTEPTRAEEVADALLSRYRDLATVLHAGERGILACGASHNTASCLTLLLPAYGRALRSAYGSDTKFDSTALLGEFFVTCFYGSTVEEVYLLLLREDHTAISCRRMALGSVNSANLNVRTLVEEALFSGAKYAVLSHNHPGGTPRPSGADIATTVSLKSGLAAVGIQLIEHLIVAGRSYAPVLLAADRLCQETDGFF